MRKISSASHAPCESFMGQDVIRNSEISMETVRKSVREHYEFVILGTLMSFPQWQGTHECLTIYFKG